ncbi:response regulator [Sulfurimonas aquatica]|uniref:histidine kinase n=1 Tax=Sulfurimonas aquatica TaxID=2672570 RepID=A0A975GDU8_9BACT|nr:response regulator [Sulfurimonas aquatica]
MEISKSALLVEDSKTIQVYLAQLFSTLDYKLKSSSTLLEVKKVIQSTEGIDIALVALDLSSKESEAIVQFLIKQDISVILLSGLEDESLKQKLLKQDIVDYIEKESLSNLAMLKELLVRLEINKKETILVVDDSSLYRALISKLLKRHNFKTLEAEDGDEALLVLKQNPDINLVVTDYEMPNLNGLGLIKEIRKEHSINVLPIIVISSLDTATTIVDCLKNGANDYLHKPFSNQEFYSRLYLTLSYKENLQNAKEQKDIYETLFHESSNGILLMKGEKFIDCNEAVLKILKLDTKEQLIGHTTYDFSPEFQPDGETSKYKCEQIYKTELERFEWQYLQSDGTPIWIDVIRTTLIIKGENIVHVVWHEISHMKKLENELALLNKSLEKRVQEEIQKNSLQASHMIEQSRLAQMGEMISMIAHQWRQPLSSISAISSTLNLDIIMDNYNSNFFQERLESINDLSQHLSSTIDDFRGFFKENKEMEESTLSTIVESTLQIIGSTLTTYSIELTQDKISNQKVTTYVNELKQVILNIIKNAEDALMESDTTDKRISINSYTQESYAYIEIEDNAGGIAEDIIKNIFDPYFSTKTEKDGTGLGLYMSKTIVEEHCQGKLSVLNTQDGAKFCIKIPIKPTI